MDIEDPHPEELIEAAATVWRRRDRRLTYVYLAFFGLVTTLLIYVWFAQTAGERACKAWLENREPRLESIAIDMTSRWQPSEITCDDEEAIRYLEASLTTASKPLNPPTNRYYYNECSVVLHFANGAEYRPPGPCRITAEEIQLSLPAKDHSPGSYPFHSPMPDRWKDALNTLLGPGTVK